LGYYAREEPARARSPRLRDGGAIPDEPEKLRNLPGIGAYTAGAVASFAYERRAALVDTNVARVLHRVFLPTVNPKSTRGQRATWAIAEQLLPRTGRHAWVHNQALMELGALICTARVRHCDRCPVARLCTTRLADR
jgi:A/G-specific adenine glycosylase